MSTWNPTSESKLEGSNAPGGGNTSSMDDGPIINDEFDQTAGLTTEPSVGDETKLQGLMDAPTMRLPLSPRKNTSPERPDGDLITGAPEVIMRRAPRTEDDFLSLSRQSYNNSETYFNAAHRNRVVDAMARYNSEHPKGSKYHNPAFEKRSKLFRPKTRSTVRKREAAMVLAMFGSSDIVNVQATKPDAQSAYDARIQEALLNYRLKADDRYYKLIVGGTQDAERQGFAIASTYWEYEEAQQYYDEIHPTLGKTARIDTVPKIDRPGVSLIPIERFHFSPGADWMDVVNSSPYLVEVRPTFLCDVRKYQLNQRAKLKYKNLSTSELLAGGSAQQWDAVRMQRERNNVNRYDRNGEVSDYAIVWVHRNIMKVDGEDYVFDTVGTTTMLSNIIPLSEFDPRGYRPYVVGSTLVEAHNPFNPGGVTLMGQLQDEINDTANLRIDANKMATAGRMFVKRNTGLDLHAMARFSPGAAIEMDNPSTDVKWDRSPEAPKGMTEEHQMMATELDDLMGNFSPSSVANNRNLNETVGGMQMIGNAADQIVEYDIHTFSKTFAEKVLGHVLDLEKQWETDAGLASIIGEKMGTDARAFWKALGTETKLEINIGFGATNPQKRLERIGTALQTLASVAPQAIQNMDQNEVAKEVFAAMGFSNASRFMPFIDDKPGAEQTDPKIKVLQQQLAQAQQMADPNQAKIQGSIQVETIRGKNMLTLQQAKQQGAEALQERENQAARDMKMMELKLAYIELQLEGEKNQIAKAQLMMEREKLSFDITMQRMQFNLERLTAQASATAPVVGQDPDTEKEAESLRTPSNGSLLSLPDFSQTYQTAGDYVSGASQSNQPEGSNP